MTIEGSIEHVMETYPLRLTVDARDDRVQVSLRADTDVTHHAQVVDAGRLRPGQLVRIDARRLADGALVAVAIEILGEPEPMPAATPEPTPPRVGPRADTSGPSVEYPSSAPSPPPEPSDPERS